MRRTIISCGLPSLFPRPSMRGSRRSELPKMQPKMLVYMTQTQVLVDNQDMHDMRLVLSCSSYVYYHAIIETDSLLSKSVQALSFCKYVHEGREGFVVSFACFIYANWLTDFEILLLFRCR
jgi:hypothetical protein